MSRLLTPLMTAGLLVPYLTMLVVYWLSDSKHSAASGLAFAGALVLGWREKSRIRQGTPSRPILGGVGLSLAILGYVASVALDFRAGVGVFAPVFLAR